MTVVGESPGRGVLFKEKTFKKHYFLFIEMEDKLIEFFDSENNLVLTDTRATKYTQNNELFIRGAYVFLFNKSLELLIKKRGVKCSKPGFWEIVSGHVDSGESYEDAAYREVKEEVGINVSLEFLEERKFTDTSKEFVAFYLGGVDNIKSIRCPEGEEFEFEEVLLP